MRLESLDMEIELSFVVDRSAREEFSAANGRLKRRTLPQVEWLGRLHVVVPIDQHRLGPWRAAPFADDDRVTRRRMDLRLKADLGQLGGQPLGATPGVGVMLGLGGNG